MLQNAMLELELKAVEIDRKEAEVRKMQADLSNTIADTQSKMVGLDKTRSETVKNMAETATSIEVQPGQVMAEEENMDLLNESLIEIMTQEREDIEPAPPVQPPLVP
jgi:hypothetical protein